MVGPMFVSQTKSFDAYNNFFSKMLSLNKDTRGILAFGTDGEEEWYRAIYNNPDEFRERLSSVKEVWDSKEQEYLQLG
jgi:hypothetical protein